MGQSQRTVRAVAPRILLSSAIALASVALTALADDHLHLGWKVQASTYDVLFQAIAGVTGVFLALYFSAVSTVAATAYKHVPTETRDLLVREKLGNIYVLLVAYLTLYSVALLSWHAIGRKPFAVAIPFSLVLSGIAVFAFVALGRRAFQFFDPVTIASLALSDLGLAIRRASGARRRPPTYQKALEVRAEAQAVTRALESLLGLTEQRPKAGRPVERLVQRMLAAAAMYQYSKPSIPSHSRWFGTRYEHPRWYLSDSSSVEVATMTSGGLSPKEVPDINWLELELMSPVRRLVSRAAQSGDLESTVAIMPHVLRLVQTTGLGLDARATIEWLTPLLVSMEESLKLSSGGANEYDPQLRLAIADFIGQLPMGLELGIAQRLANMSQEKLDERLLTADLGGAGSAYRIGQEFLLPRRCVEALEVIAAGVAFEQTAASGVCTPGWYARDLVFNNLRWAIQNEWQASYDFATSVLLPIADRLKDSGLHAEAAAVRSRALELSSKLAGRADLIEERDGFLKSRTILSDLPGPTWDLQSIADGVPRYRIDVLRSIAESIPDLAFETTATSSLPDQLGQAVHYTGEACYDALRRGDFAEFAALFRPYFLGILTVADSLRGEVINWIPESAAAMLAAPLVDLMSISGYALIYSELFGDPSPRETVAALWTSWLDNAPVRLQHLNAMATVEREIFALQPRAILRTRWEMDLGSRLSEIPMRASQDAERPWREQPRDHPSPLIRRIAPHGWSPAMMSYDARDVFVSLFLWDRPDAADLPFGARGNMRDHLLALREAVRGGAPDGGTE